MERIYKTSETTAQIIASLRCLYEFYDKFTPIFETEPAPGQVPEADFQDKWHALKDCVLLLIAYRLEYALLERSEGATAQEIEF